VIEERGNRTNVFLRNGDRAVTRKCPTGRGATAKRVTVAVLSVISAFMLATGCSQQQPSPRPPTTATKKNPFEDLPVVLGREALTLKQQTEGLGSLFNEPVFQERKQDAARVKTEDEAKIKQLEQEIKERFAYINAVEKIRSDIEKSSEELPRYLERLNQISFGNPSNEELWKVAAIWVELEKDAILPRQFAEDVCVGQMAQKYLAVSDQVAKQAENRVQSVLTNLYDAFSNVSANYGKESSAPRLEQHIVRLNRFTETLSWVGSEYYSMHKTLYEKARIARGDTSQPIGGTRELFSMSLEELNHDIRITVDNIRSHIAICKVYNECMSRFAQLMDNGLQAKDVAAIDALKKRLSDEEPHAPNKDSSNLLASGRNEMDARVEREVQRMRQTRDQLDALCNHTPDFAQPQSFVERLRKGQEEMRTAKEIFDALGQDEDGDKAGAVKDHLGRLEKAYDKLREMHFALEEMKGFAKELQQLPGYGARSSDQQQRATQMREKLRDYKIKFSQWVRDSELEERADECLMLIDELVRKIGE
jgi:hypothetical protein